VSRRGLRPDEQRTLALLGLPTAAPAPALYASIDDMSG
jgi:hypothetical protein